MFRSSKNLKLHLHKLINSPFLSFLDLKRYQSFLFIFYQVFLFLIDSIRDRNSDQLWGVGQQGKWMNSVLGISNKFSEVRVKPFLRGKIHYKWYSIMEGMSWRFTGRKKYETFLVVGRATYLVSCFGRTRFNRLGYSWQISLRTSRL